MIFCDSDEVPLWVRGDLGLGVRAQGESGSRPPQASQMSSSPTLKHCQSTIRLPRPRGNIRSTPPAEVEGKKRAEGVRRAREGEEVVGVQNPQGLLFVLEARGNEGKVRSG